MSNEKKKVVQPKNLNNLEEAESIEYASELLTSYKEMEAQLRKEYEGLMKTKEKFPSKYLKETNFEDLMLQAASAKFDAIKVARRLSGLEAEISVELEYIKANFKLYISEAALSEKFDKITEGLRDAYVISKMELKELTKLKDKVNNFSDSAEKLIKAFDGDEINFRRIADKINKMNGWG